MQNARLDEAQAGIKISGENEVSHFPLIPYISAMKW